MSLNALAAEEEEGKEGGRGVKGGREVHMQRLTAPVSMKVHNV